MLVSLEINNFGLVDHLELSFKPGLTVLTGETGAGKSIIIDALQVALGGRAYVEYIKSDAEKALVQAVFEPGNLPDLEKLLADRGLDYEDGLLIMARQLTRTGRNTCRINGRITTLQIFKQVGNYLLDMHGQHEQQSLLNPSKHIELLDRFSGEQLMTTKTVVAELYKKWQSVKDRLEGIKAGRRERARQMDMLKYQIQEIDRAALQENEEEDLKAAKNYAANAETIARLTQDAYIALYGGDDGIPSAVDQLGKTIENLEKLVEFDRDFVPLLETVSSALYQLEDVSRDLVSHRDGIDFEPGRLEEIESRLNEIARLKAKYGGSVPEILAFREQSAKQLAELENSEITEDKLEEENSKLENEYMTRAAELSGLRHVAAEELKRAVEKELNDLEMKGVTLEIKFTAAEPGPRGVEEIEFQIATNPGEPPKPLAKIASGGELSRIMLAFKCILARVDQIPTLVFDEVDTGIGGKTLQAVARKLEQLSRVRQTIVVTHAAAIAALSDVHYHVFKTSCAEKTRTEMVLLEGENRVRELARMLGGKEISPPVLEHARQLLKQK